jgi:hypothetical protein
MPKALKMSTVAVVVLLGLASMGMIGLKDALKRPGYCANCHADIHYGSWEHSEYLVHTHAEAAIRCQTCHPQDLSTGVHNITTSINWDHRLRPLRVPKNVCLQCHAHGSYEELVARTGEGERNPHDSHYGEIDCRICHKMHRASIDYCSGCHDPTASGEGWVLKEKMNIKRGKPPAVMPPGSY